MWSAEGCSGVKEMQNMNPSLLEKSEKYLHRNGVTAEHQRRLSTASVLHWLSVIWTIPAFFVSAWTALWALAASPDDSEWGRTAQAAA
jgi:hypothetical protein